MAANINQEREMENCSGKRNGEKSYKGIRMRRWGRWEANIREPIKKSRIWLGTYSSPVAAARAYDTALYYIYGPTSRLNFPELLAGEVSSDGDIPQNMSLATIRKKALKVGARVDALEASTVANGRQEPPPSGSEMIRLQPCRLEEKPDLNNIPDLNKSPEPEDPDEDIL